MSRVKTSSMSSAVITDPRVHLGGSACIPEIDCSTVDEPGSSSGIASSLLG